MIYRISDAAKPPRGFRPYTLKGLVAIILDGLQPQDSRVIGGIVTLSGSRPTPSSIRATVIAVAPPGHRYAYRTIQGEQIKIWRTQ